MLFYANKCVIWSPRSFMFSQPKIADLDLQIEQRLPEIQIPLASLRSYTASWTSVTQQLLSSLNALRVISSFATIKTNCSSTFMLTCKRMQDTKILNDTKWYTYEYMVGMIMEFGTQNIPLSSQSITSFERQAERKNIHFGGAQNHKNSQGQRGLTASGMSPFTKCS